MRLILVTTILTMAATVSSAQERSDDHSSVVWIGLQHGSEPEAQMAAELRALLRKYDLQPWILTRRVLIDESTIPRSHPILTIHTRHIGDEHGLLSTFVHEQLHWLEEAPWLGRFNGAMAEYRRIFPDVPDSSSGGARDDVSTYRHLLVCDLEFQAMTAIVGEAVARKTLNRFSHYEWIYEQVLTDPRIREVALRHGFDVSEGVPGVDEVR